MNERKAWSVFIRLLIGLWMLAVLVLQAMTVLMLWDLSQREGFVLHDESLSEVLTRLDQEIGELREGGNR